MPRSAPRSPMRSGRFCSATDRAERLAAAKLHRYVTSGQQSGATPGRISSGKVEFCRSQRPSPTQADGAASTIFRYARPFGCPCRWAGLVETPAHLATQILPATFLSPHALAERGLSRHAVSRLVSDGVLLRLRNGRYVPSHIHRDLIDAGRIGGRLDCVSLLSALGVFVRLTHLLHAQFDPATTRLPPRHGVIAHWRRSSAEPAALAADLIEALVQACRCQCPRDAIATLDSAWHHTLVDEEGLAMVFARLPRRYRNLRALLDRRSESGAETLMRLLLRGLGVDVQVQVHIDGVGRVDLVVDGWLIVECDSRAHHEGWEAQKRDRARDMAAAALGYTTVRPIAEDIMYRMPAMLESMRAIVAHPPRR
jgi:very-short-patch-repair endonuclease